MATNVRKRTTLLGALVIAGIVLIAIAAAAGTAAQLGLL